MPKLAIERSIRVIRVVEINEDNYPGMTPVQARDSEYDLDRGEKVEGFVEDLSVVDPNKPLNWGEYGVTCSFSETVTIIPDDKPRLMA
jgi:hypothetical protein